MNVWVALTYEGHIHHLAAQSWFMALDRDTRLCFCRITQISLLRLLTTQAVMGEAVMSQAAAWQVYDRWLDDDRIFFVEEPVGLEQAFRALSPRTHPAPKDWADAYLAAFASVAGMRLVTFDRAFRNRIPNVLLIEP